MTRHTEDLSRQWTDFTGCSERKSIHKWTVSCNVICRLHIGNQMSRILFASNSGHDSPIPLRSPLAVASKR